jgi:CBS domain-containing protein
MQIEGITLWLFGGVAKFRGMFRSAGEEFRIAVAGPLVSLVIGLVFAFVPTALSLPDAVDGVAAWLGYINLTLLVFNLLPALPLDGGRILRSALWQAKADYSWATRVSTTIARLCGLAVIAAGAFLLVSRSTFTGIWLALIGWFLVEAAGGERRTLALQERLAGLRVGDAMARHPVAVSANLTLGRFLSEIAQHQPHAAYPVLDGGRVVGLVALRDAAASPHARWDETTVRDFLLPRERVPILAEGDTLFDALAELGDSAGHGLVLDGERLAGVISLSDVEHALAGNPDLSPHR